MASETYSRHLIRMARRRAGLTQQALATRAGTSQAAMSAYESGRRSPSVDTLCRILGAAGFEVRVRLAAPDTHDAARVMAESLLPSDQVAAHAERERTRRKHRGSGHPPPERSTLASDGKLNLDEGRSGMSDEVLRPTEAAERLGVPTRVVIRAMYDRKIPRGRLDDGTLGIPADALVDFVPQSA